MNVFTGRLPKGFRYVPQDNYILVNPETSDYTYLYSDSATSCIIVVVVGKDAGGQPLVALTHLSRKERFETFFALVSAKFVGPFSVYAQGANPPQAVQKGKDYSYEALKNSAMLLKWAAANIFIPDNSVAPLSYISQCTVTVGSGDPNTGYGGYGINIDKTSPDYMSVSDKMFHLENVDRDPGNGIQTLYSVYGVNSGYESLLLRSVESDFSKDDIKKLVDSAKQHNWEKIVDMSDDEILDKYSSTPQFEAYWFCDEMRTSSEYVINYKGE